MKTRICLFVTGIFLLICCIKDNDKTISEIPKDLIRTKLDSAVYKDIIDLFPNGFNAKFRYPFLFSDTIENRIILTEETEVYLTYIAENANFRNTLGWYSYPLSNPPLSVNDIKINVLFPNISNKGEGGELLQGDMMQLSKVKFPKGTVIGFFLLVNGWWDGDINYKAQMHCTDKFMNKDGNQQHIMFKLNKSKHIVLGFEDMLFDEGDKDFNDILLIISDNRDNFESIYFEMKKMASF